MAVRSPLLGYNTNVRHAGKLFHIQTEDSGQKHPHIITHLFADGGRIVASTKSSYADVLGAENLQEVVKAKMREQHKAMFIALRDGHYDEPGEAAGASKPASVAPTAERSLSTRSFEAPKRSSPPAGLLGSRGSGAYAAAAPVLGSTPPPDGGARAKIAASMTLDEVILSYLAQDLEAQPAG
ncbi:MAG: hypothetical protein R3A78_15340 [Polyangiales bacterium]